MGYEACTPYNSGKGTIQIIQEEDEISIKPERA
jgi:hypothetical protein